MKKINETAGMAAGYVAPSAKVMTIAASRVLCGSELEQLERNEDSENWF